MAEPFKKRVFSEEEISYIRDNWHKVKIHDMEKHLEASHTTIYNVACELGLPIQSHRKTKDALDFHIRMLLEKNIPFLSTEIINAPKPYRYYIMRNYPQIRFTKITDKRIIVFYTEQCRVTAWKYVLAKGIIKKDGNYLENWGRAILGSKLRTLPSGGRRGVVDEERELSIKKQQRVMEWNKKWQRAEE